MIHVKPILAVKLPTKPSQMIVFQCIRLSSSETRRPGNCCQARRQKCGMGVRVPKALEWIGGTEGAEVGSGVSPLSGGWVWEGLCPLSRRGFVVSPSKWCIFMHSGAHFAPTIIVTMIMTSTVTFLSCTCSTLNNVAKGRLRNFCADFSGRVSTHVAPL